MKYTIKDKQLLNSLKKLFLNKKQTRLFKTHNIFYDKNTFFHFVILNKLSKKKSKKLR